MKSIMIQGTGSHVGKSVIATALCRILRKDGHRVAPFKSQNMSNNSFVCPDGGEVSRAQAVQAEACGLEPQVQMNPVLLKPSSDTGCQVVVLGKSVGHMRAQEYQNFKLSLMDVIRDAFERLTREFDIVVIEGAGSPAEINLRQTEIVNMLIARMARAPVLLVGDIEHGGVFAQFVGTLELLEPEERDLVRGFIINKFRGDREILKSGVESLQQRTGKPVVGTIPYLSELQLAEEDTIPETKLRPDSRREGKLQIHIVKLPSISNFTDFDPLEKEPLTSVRYIGAPPDFETPDLLILPGTKSTVADLDFLRCSGLARFVHRSIENGAYVLGVCGGYQMLGRRILDPLGVESSISESDGLGLIDAVTVFSDQKETTRVKGVHLSSGAPIQGYEIHMGCTQGFPGEQPLFRITERHGMSVQAFDGVRIGRVFGTYIHGLFDSALFRTAFLNEIRSGRGLPFVEPAQGQQTDKYDRLAEIVRGELDMRFIYGILG